MMKLGGFAAFVAALMVCLPVTARSDERRPLLKLAETVCMHGERVEDSKIFAQFKLRGPFLFVSSGPNMLAMPALSCHNLRQAEVGSVLLVIGHRAKPGVAVFFLTSLAGNLIESARGFSVTGEEPVFLSVPIDEVRDEFERAKRFWLVDVDLSPVAFRND
jgi:hypothetical protein